MMREPRRGELQSVANSVAYSIWLTRNVEPEECEKHGMSGDYVSDPEDDVNLDYARKFWSLLETLTPREAKVLEMRYALDLTLEEIGVVLNVTRERVRQIEGHAIRRLKHPDRVNSIGEVPDRWRLARSNIHAKKPAYAWGEWA